jgi:hypothetical protein
MLLTASVNPITKCDSETRIGADHFTHSPAFEAIPPRSGLMVKDVARTAIDCPVVKRVAFWGSQTAGRQMFDLGQ